jgi:hypothetical protein
MQQSTAPKIEQFHHICTKDNAHLFEKCPQGYSTGDVPVKAYLKKGTKICVLEDFVEYRHVIVPTLDESIIPQGHQAIEELDQFEYVWLIFVFHKNSPCSVERTRIRPPRMDGNQRVGIYATQTPHRPNAIWLDNGKDYKNKKP